MDYNKFDLNVMMADYRKIEDFMYELNRIRSYFVFFDRELASDIGAVNKGIYRYIENTFAEDVCKAIMKFNDFLSDLEGTGDLDMILINSEHC